MNYLPQDFVKCPRPVVVLISDKNEANEITNSATNNPNKVPFLNFVQLPFQSTQQINVLSLQTVHPGLSSPQHTALSTSASGSNSSNPKPVDGSETASANPNPSSPLVASNAASTAKPSADLNASKPNTGLFRTDWLLKKHTSSPCIVCLVLRWPAEWSVEAEKEWREGGREQAIMAELEALQTVLKPLPNLKLMVVLLLDTVSSIPSIDERRIAFQRFTTPKHILEFNLADPANAYKNLEKHLYQKAIHFYQLEGNQLKQLMNNSNVKNFQPLVLSQYNFMLAIIYEIRDLASKALGLYVQAYQLLREQVRAINTSKISLHEAKVYAGLLNFKICSLNFVLGRADESVAQFLRHTQHYGKLNAPEDPMEFRHWAWLAQEYECFGDLVSQYSSTSANAGLLLFSLDGPSHAGYNMHRAADAAIRRRRAFQFFEPRKNEEAMQALMRVVVPYNPYAMDAQRQLYIGQNQTEMAFNTSNEEGRQALANYQQQALAESAQQPSQSLSQLQLDIAMAQELVFDHIFINTTLLHRAIEEYNSSAIPRPRKQNQLIFELALEHKERGQYREAERLFETLLQGSYATEQWPLLLKDVLRHALDCAIILEDIDKELQYATHLLALPGLAMTAQEKTDVQSKMFARVQGQSKPSIVLNWNYKRDSLLFCKLEFPDVSVFVNQEIPIVIQIISKFPSDIVLQRSRLHFDNSETLECEETTVLKPDTPTRVTLRTTKDKESILQCSTIELFTGDSLSQPLLVFLYDTKNWPKTTDDWSEVPQTSIRVDEEKPTVEVSVVTQAPPLLNEFYELEVTIANQNKYDIHNAELTLEYKETSSATVKDTFLIVNERDANAPLSQSQQVSHVSTPTAVLSIPTIPSMQKLKRSLLVFIETLAVGRIEIKVKYETKKDQSLPAIIRTIDLAPIIPFLVSFHYFTSDFQPIDTTNTNPAPEKLPLDYFFLQVDVVANKEVPIQLMQLQPLISNVVNETNPVATISEPRHSHTVILPSHRFTEVLKVTPLISGTVDIGRIAIRWERARQGRITRAFDTQLPLPHVHLAAMEIDASLSYPPQGYFGSAFALTVRVTNRTSIVQEFQLKAFENDYFLFGGDKQLFFPINAGDTYEVVYSLFPLVVGQAMLPKFHLLVVKANQRISKLLADKFVSIKPDNLETEKHVF